MKYELVRLVVEWNRVMEEIVLEENLKMMFEEEFSLIIYGLENEIEKKIKEEDNE